MGGQQNIPHISSKRAITKSVVGRPLDKKFQSPFNNSKSIFSPSESLIRTQHKMEYKNIKNDLNITPIKPINSCKYRYEAPVIKILHRNTTSINMQNQQTSRTKKNINEKLDPIKEEPDSKTVRCITAGKKPRNAVKGQFYQSKVKRITIISKKLPSPIFKENSSQKPIFNSQIQNNLSQAIPIPYVKNNECLGEDPFNFSNKNYFESFTQSQEQSQLKRINDSSSQSNLKRSALKINIKLIECEDETKNNPEFRSPFSPKTVQRKSVVEECFENKINELEKNFLNRKISKNNSRKQRILPFIRKTSLSSDNLGKQLQGKKLNMKSPDFYKKNMLFDENSSSNHNHKKETTKKPLVFFQPSPIVRCQKIEEDFYKPNPEAIHSWWGENGPLDQNNPTLKNYYAKVHEE